MTPAGFPHSDIPGSQLGCQLPRAYRRLQRPSSALDAKASTMCPSQLAATNTTPHPPIPKDQPGALRRRHTTRHKRNSHHNHHHPRPPPTGRAGPAFRLSCADTKSTHHTPQATTQGTGRRMMLASTIHISNNNPTPPTSQLYADQRCGRDETTLPHHPGPTPRTEVQQTQVQQTQVQAPTPGMGVRVRFQNPNSVSPPQATGHHPPSGGAAPEQPNTGRASTEFPLMNTTGATRRTPVTGCVLLRKEVIQPHLPVRLPCYDFVPIASPTFDHSLQQAGWAMGFGCCRLS